MRKRIQILLPDDVAFRNTVLIIVWSEKFDSTPTQTSNNKGS